jgi:uncharacterized protein (DUF934 family)
MRRLIRHGELVDGAADPVATATLDALPACGPAIVSLALWQQARAALLARGGVGVELSPADDPAALAGDVAVLPVIAIRFPAFTDGRGYSTARLLRERYGYRGELRAVGDVRRDQAHYLRHVGFDAFEVDAATDAAGFIAALADFTDGYQGTARRAPWFRRRGGELSGGSAAP